jgi:hypothetical protein
VDPNGPKAHNAWSSVPPVGVEPTLGTLLGGRPLPLGYGGLVIIPRSLGITLGQLIKVARFPANVAYLIHVNVVNIYGE